MIEELHWDSEFFGYKTGKLIIPDGGNFNYSEFESVVNNYRLIYIFSKKKITEKRLKLVDKKVTFHQQIPIKTCLKKSYNSKIESFNIKLHNYESLKKLALTSGIYSRFNIDKNFKNNEYLRLYSQWIKNAVFKDKTLDILIYQEKGICGFTTIEEKTKDLADIGLVAVSEKTRGKGIATKLIENSIKKAFQLGFKEIQVVTQSNNIPAMKLYEKCNFKINEITYIYHYWNL